MREILFKAKRVDNGEWVEGLLYKELNNFYGKSLFNIQRINKFGIPIAVYEINPETVGQYTGLTDKNGKRIFEGDIVHLTDVRYDTEWRAIVEFGNPYGEYTWGWNFYHIGEKAKVNTDILLWAEMEDVEVYCEVIGNRFDNSELLAER